MNRSEVYAAIDAERAYQAKWGLEFDHANTPNDWVTYIVKYLGQCVTLPWNGDTFRKQMVKVAALAVAALEQYDYAPSHYDEANVSRLGTKQGRVA